MSVEKINVFVLNWCSVDHVDRCVKSILNSLGVAVRIFLINNYSSFDDYVRMEELFGETQDAGVESYFINNIDNCGYSGGNNAAYSFVVNECIPGHILIINPDVCLAENSLQCMLAALAKNVGIVTPRTLYFDGQFMHGSIRLSGFSQSFLPEKSTGVSATDYSQGACMLLNRDALQGHSIFDNRFFMYWEEVDLSLRIKKNKMKLVVANEAVVYRDKNEPSREPYVFFYSIRNSLLIKRLHPDCFSVFSYIFYIIKTIFLSVKFIRNPRVFFRVFMSCMAGLIYSIRGIYGKRGI